ncbi:MAG: shikimate kinase [Candidatus Omnitrophota bacterium]
MKNIVLTGFMGTGKTAVAKELSVKMSMPHVSVDKTIESREKKTINEIFRVKGETYFRNLEREIIKELSSEQGCRIIDCGGGAVIDRENLKNLKASGTVFCLWASPEAILKRVGSSSDRPLLNVKDPVKKIEELLEKRKSCYLESDFHIDTTGLCPDEVADEIRRMLDDIQAM